jgi:CRISPR type III-B/RAMP module RAMP protein Cmr1
MHHKNLWLPIQKCLEPIAKIQIKNITYSIVGGYNAGTFSYTLNTYEALRSQTVKGVWRWWLRALLASVINDVKEIRNKENEILGSTEYASRYVLHVYNESQINKVQEESVQKYKILMKEKKLRCNVSEIFPKIKSSRSIIPLPPRIILLLQLGNLSEISEKISGYNPGSLNSTIKVFKRANSNSQVDKVAISALLLSIILGGFGAITKRGFGSFKIEKLELNNMKEIEDIILKTYNSKDIEEIKNNLNNLIKISIDYAKEYLNKSSTINKIPEISSLCMDNIDNVKPFEFDVIKINTDIKDEKINNLYKIFNFDLSSTLMLTKIGYSKTKLLWKLHSGKDLTDKGFEYHTWVLGFPRSQEYDTKKLKCEKISLEIHENSKKDYREVKSVITGYDAGSNRRASSITIKPLIKLKESEWIVLAYRFISKDWFPEIYHYSLSPPPKKGVCQYKLTKKVIYSQKELVDKINKAYNRVLQIL